MFFTGAFASGLVGVGGAIVMIPLLLYVPPLLGVGSLDIKLVAGVTMAHQMRPSAPVDRLSGMPGRLVANGVNVPAFGPVSQYFDSRRPCVSAITRADPSAVGVWVRGIVGFSTRPQPRP